MQLQESGEMYLEAVRVLSLHSSRVRSIDVAGYLHFSKPSVSRAINLLKDNGYLNVGSDGSLTLTDSGLEIANTMYERHRVLTAVLANMGVNPQIAEEDACKIEHDIRPETFEAIKRHAIEHGMIIV